MIKKELVFVIHILVIPLVLQFFEIFSRYVKCAVWFKNTVCRNLHDFTNRPALI